MLLYLLSGLLAVFAFIAAWLWLCGGLLRTGWRGIAGKLAVQASGLMLAYGCLRGSLWTGLFMALTAPLSAVLEIARLKAYTDLGATLAWQAAPAVAVVGAVSLALAPLRIWAPGLALVAGLIAVLWQAEGISQRAMCETAARYGVTAFPRNAFLWSLANAPQEFQFEIHARLDAQGQRLGWSYRAMDWYVIPKGASDAVTGAVFTCPPVS